MIVGGIYQSNRNGLFKVDELLSDKQVKITFIETGFTSVVFEANARKGQVKDFYRVSVYGKGFLGGTRHKTKIDNRTSPVYRRWCHMLSRCFNEKDSSFPRYGGKGVTVVKDWLNFQTYADWFYQQCHENQQKPLETNWHVDSDNGEVKVYSPKTCKLILPFDNIQKARKDKGKNISLVHTDGKILKDVKISEAVEKTGLNKSTVYRLINGKTSEVNGWKNKGDSFD